MATRISASVRPYTLTERDRHLVTRFSFGVDGRSVREIGPPPIGKQTIPWGLRNPSAWGT